MTEADGGSEQDDVSFLRTVSSSCEFYQVKAHSQVAECNENIEIKLQFFTMKLEYFYIVWSINADFIQSTIYAIYNAMKNCNFFQFYCNKIQ